MGTPETLVLAGVGPSQIVTGEPDALIHLARDLAEDDVRFSPELLDEVLDRAYRE